MQEILAGWLCTLVAILGFGSNYIPVKKVDTGDGMFFTMCNTTGILLVGFVQWCAAGFYKFEPFAMVGGLIWAIGNLLVPFIVQRCGLGIGQLVWGLTNMLAGWASGAFGILGKDKDVVQSPWLNYLGVAFAVLSLGLFSLMKPDGPGTETIDVECSGQRAQQRGSGGFVMGFVCALVAGVFFGLNFNPPTYLQQQGAAAGHSTNSMDYVFSHFCGIFVFTACCFAIYCATARERNTSPKLILPGLLCGMGWGIAQVGWFKANSVLSYVVAFPIIVGVPGVLAAIWGVILFGENRSQRNLGLLLLVILVQGVAVLCIALSKGNSTSSSVKAEQNILLF